MKASAVLQEAYDRLSSTETSRQKTVLAMNDMGMRVHPTSNSAVSWSTVGSLMTSLDRNREDGSLPTRSVTQRLFYSDSYGYLTEAAQHMGFRTISDLEEFGTDEQFLQMWEAAIATAHLCENEGVN